MKNATKFLTFGFTIIFAQSSYAVLDDNLGMTEKTKRESVYSSKSKNEKRILASKSKKNKRILSRTASIAPLKLGNVPRHIQENWNALSKDQKEVIYSYHNENPYAQINKEYFKNISKPESDYEQDSDFGFDGTQQASLDDLRSDINGATKAELSDETKLVIENLAALEE